MYKYLTLIFLLITASSISPALAQERTLSNNSPGTLRIWKQTGHWQVGLIRNTKHQLTCLLGTGKLNSSRQITYLYGLVHRNNSTRLFIIDRDDSALSGNTISVRVDGVSVGSYPITYRHDSKNAILGVIESKLSENQDYRIEHLFSYGSRLEFKTDGATYLSSLGGAGQGIFDFHNCINEVDALIINKK